MKKLLPLFLILCLLLCACGGNDPVDTTEPETTENVTTEPETTEPETTEPETTEPETTEAPTEPFNPLNGQTLEEPYTGRIFGTTINNVSPALPYQGVSQADMFFEFLINDNATRCLALFTDVRSVPSIGSVRSSRMNYVDICQAYDVILGHAGYGNGVKDALNNRGVEHLHLGNVAGYRDQNRLNAGYDLEHTLFVNGQRFYDAAVKAGYEVEQPAGKDYGLRFTENATPENGETAAELHISFWGKMTHFYFNEQTGKYDLYLHGKYMVDENNGQQIAFQNLIVMKCQVENNGFGSSYPYHYADVLGSGDGYFANGGKLIPIKWIHENEADPFTFTLADGTPLELGVGNTYVALAPIESEFTYE